MSYSHTDADEPAYRLQRPAPAGMAFALAWRGIRTLLWAAINIALVFTEQVAELAAPLLLLVGAAWWMLPKALGLIVLDGQAGDVLRSVTAKLPTEVLVGGYWLSASKLITDAFLLFALVAVCRTLATLTARVLITDR